MNFISNAIAATATPAPIASENSFSFIMIIGMFVLFYFLLIRPQNKRAKEQKEMINQLKKGDEIITLGGMLGKIVELNDQFVKVSFAENVEVFLQRNAINSIVPKGTMKSL